MTFLTWQGKVIIIAKEVMLAQMVLVLTTWSCNKGDADWVVAHRVGDRGRGARVTTNRFEGVFVRALTSAQRHQGSKGMGVRHNMGRRGSDSVIVIVIC